MRKENEMSELEIVLLNYYRGQPINCLTYQEVDELLFLEVKLGLEEWNKTKRGIK